MSDRFTDGLERGIQIGADGIKRHFPFWVFRVPISMDKSYFASVATFSNLDDAKAYIRQNKRKYPDYQFKIEKQEVKEI